MFNFLGDLFYLFLLALILVIFVVINKNSWSKGVISKEPNALLKNNFLIILDLFLVVFAFIKFSWVAGITSLVSIFILYIILARKIAKKLEEDLFKPKK
jgi:TRAP-type mannitol/chloroaromatic compound transport system permease small subunit